MARTKGAKGKKKKAIEVVETTEIQGVNTVQVDEIKPEVPEVVEKVKVVEAPKVVEDDLRPTEIEGLPNRPTLRVSEVAYYYGVSERTVYLWIQNGKLKTIQTPAGQWRVTRKSLDTKVIDNMLRKSREAA